MRNIKILWFATLALAFTACGGGGDDPTTSQPFKISGNLSGLGADKQVILQNNQANPTTIASNGKFSFSEPIPANGSYAVTVASQPVGQSCSVSSASGTNVQTDVSVVTVVCSDLVYKISGTVTGLAGGEQVRLLNQGGDETTVSANGGFQFDALIEKNGSYAITVGTQPPGQICTVSHGTGAGVVADVGNVQVLCSEITYPVSGTVTGLLAGEQLTLRNNAADPLTVTGSGPFTFATPIVQGGSYVVTIDTQPVSKTCSVSFGSGTGASHKVSDVAVVCSSRTYQIGGMIGGLSAGEQVTLLNNGADPLIVSSNGPFTFPMPMAYNSSYIVTVAASPTGKVCDLANIAGKEVTADVSNIAIDCKRPL
jgi:uncharacterized protein YfaP (DUF2135 family)